MHRKHCPKILRDVGVGKKTVRLVSRFWNNGVLYFRATGHYGQTFHARRGVTQGGSLSPTIFNLMVDAVVREWERQLVAGRGRRLEPEDVRELFGCFYADNGMVAVHDLKQIQLTFDFCLIALFDRVLLKINTLKTETMTFLA